MPNPASVTGLSPRVRGNPGGGPGGKILVRSIPACAGEPNQRPIHRLEQGGLSPSVRGNLQRTCDASARPRSIPACAGEPDDVGGHWAILWVYPRVCGGTGIVCPAGIAGVGLSPRVRGNLYLPGVFVHIERSIPACAGEPEAYADGTCAVRVYPRVCGGTRRLTPAAPTGMGLSPRVRGNRRRL